MPSIRTSHGEDGDIGFTIDNDGNILSVSVTEEFGPIPVRFNTKEFIEYYGSLDDCIDILDIGYTFEDGTYEPPENDFRVWSKINTHVTTVTDAVGTVLSELNIEAKIQLMTSVMYTIANSLSASEQQVFYRDLYNTAQKQCGGESYEMVEAIIQDLPQTWYPQLIKTLLTAAHHKLVFKTDGMRHFVNNHIAALDPIAEPNTGVG